MLTEHLPRIALAHLPTPLEELPRLTKALGGPRLYIKRDDQTGLAGGGNKARKLEFSVAEALRQGADTLITLGEVQSNHCRQTAAAAARCGLRCIVVLRGHAPATSNGNLLLDYLLGAQVVFSGVRTREAVAEDVAKEQRAAGHRPHVIPVGASNEIGAVGFVAAIEEMDRQLKEQRLNVDHVVFASSSYGTQAGLCVGAKAVGFTPRIAPIAIVITTGNHVWDKKEFIAQISKEDRLLRPLNYPPGVPGYGSIIYPLANGEKVAVVNMSGRVFMSNIDCPFRTAKTEVEKLSNTTKMIIIDFHGETTSEKIAFSYFMDGKVSAIIGTHTHVQTADEKILAGGTAYITDIGMTGPENSVIGIEKEQVIDRFLTNLPVRFETAKGEGIFSAAVVDINENTGKATAIQRLQLRYP